MGMSDRLADMNEVYVHTKTACKEQPAIRLWHMKEKFGGLTVPKKGCARTQHEALTNQLADMDGPNVRRHQPRPRYAGAEDKLIAETWQHMEEQFTVLGDEIRALTTQFSNTSVHNRDGYGDPYAERGTHGLQQYVQAHANQWGNKFKLNIRNSKGIYNPKNFWIGCWLLKRVLNSTRCLMNDKSLWWYTHSGEELLSGGNN
jgi:hypothetical protein